MQHKTNEKSSKRLVEVGKDIAARNTKRSELEGFLKTLDSSDELLTEFDEALWLGVVHQMKVHSVEGVTLVLKDESEVVWVPLK